MLEQITITLQLALLDDGLDELEEDLQDNRSLVFARRECLL